MNNIPKFFDNTSATVVFDNPVQHSRTERIDIRHHFIREHVEKGNIKLQYIPTEKQLANIFTKLLDKSTISRLIGELGMLHLPY